MARANRSRRRRRDPWKRIFFGIILALFLGGTGFLSDKEVLSLERGYLRKSHRRAVQSLPREKEEKKPSRSAAKGSAHVEKDLDALVCHVSDGDTVDIRDENGEEVRLRFYGIDAPESSQEFGPQARRYVKEALLNRKVHVKIRYKDLYGRSVATVFLDGEDFSLKLLRKGYVWHYEQYCDDPEYARAQREAQEKERGLWGEAKRMQHTPVPPWQYRKEHPRRK